MKLLLLHLSWMFSIAAFSQTHSHQSLKFQDSLIISKEDNKSKSLILKQGSRVKIKGPGRHTLEGHVHKLSADTLILVSKIGLHYVPYSTIRRLAVFNYGHKQWFSTLLIDKGLLILIPATAALIYSLNLNSRNGWSRQGPEDLAQTIAISAGLSLISGAMIRWKKIRLEGQWLIE